ncbi:MAG: histidine--tRNA ligase [Deltaproteobacteria bacterium]|nr:histidine--tRNA ligase [Deltaproteobacteria bacterium]MBI3390779.1 histidine--tRNA ligase [Deltaproteobacteria bacterium]
MKFPSVKGFRDVLPDESARWSWLEAQARAVFQRYNVTEVRLPIVERTSLFSRSIGDTTDIVEKEMYTFSDRDGTALSLRPEGTASVVRAYVEHAVAQREPVSKWFYLGPMFRRERPQKGRTRQFSQIGVEVIGRDDAAADAEVLLLLSDLLGAMHVTGVELQINSLGCGQCRPAYRELLAAYGAARREQLCENCTRRLERNPLRLLDCKVPTCQAATADAPMMLDHLCAACAAHFSAVRALVDREGVAVVVNPRIVRGLDYYNRTAFEVLAPGLGAQNAIGAGGRYDGLVKEIGGPDVGGIGFALGMERLTMVLPEMSVATPPAVFICPVGAAAESDAMHLAHRLRTDGGLAVEIDAAGKSLKSQMRRADKSGARFALIIGEDELARQAATVRDMVAKRDYPSALPLTVSVDELQATLARLSERAGDPA